MNDIYGNLSHSAFHHAEQIIAQHHGIERPQCLRCGLRPVTIGLKESVGWVTAPWCWECMVEQAERV